MRTWWEDSHLQPRRWVSVGTESFTWTLQPPKLWEITSVVEVSQPLGGGFVTKMLANFGLGWEVPSQRTTTNTLGCSNPVTLIQDAQRSEFTWSLLFGECSINIMRSLWSLHGRVLTTLQVSGAGDLWVGVKGAPPTSALHLPAPSSLTPGRSC